jgi:hypothetical protein
MGVGRGVSSQIVGKEKDDIGPAFRVLGEDRKAGADKEDGKGESHGQEEPIREGCTAKGKPA